jgi:O-antigen biosynthesis protein WbqP
MKRLFDIVFSIVLLVILLMPMILIAIAVKASSGGKILYWSDRVGRDNIIF